MWPRTPNRNILLTYRYNKFIYVRELGIIMILIKDKNVDILIMQSIYGIALDIVLNINRKNPCVSSTKMIKIN